MRLSVSKITDVHTIEEIHEQAMGSRSSGVSAGGDHGSNNISGILYASITAFNFDAEDPLSVIVTRW